MAASWPAKREIGARQAHDRLDHPVEFVDCDPAFGEQRVIGVMLAGMDRFLRREGAHIALERRVRDLARVVLHAIDEKAFAFGKVSDSVVVVGGDDRIAGMPTGR